eukprot:137913-Pyramimonas_sp.AAC.1
MGGAGAHPAAGICPLLARLAHATGIRPLPSRDWCTLLEYALSPRAIGCFGRAPLDEAFVEKHLAAGVVEALDQPPHLGELVPSHQRVLEQPVEELLPERRHLLQLHRG